MKEIYEERITVDCRRFIYRKDKREEISTEVKAEEEKVLTENE